jgi:release factor glutamine methyltransferase
MNANSLQKTPAISHWVLSAIARLNDASIPSSRLDAEIILAHTLRKSRTYLHAHGDETLSDREYEVAEARLQLRLDRTPVAYIIGHKEFYGRSFRVTPATLIPRPESETIITILKDILAQQDFFTPSPKLVDVGTGSGCLGITAKLEFPSLDVTLLDISNHALTVAKANAARLKADVTIERSDLLSDYPFAASIIIANLPYVDPTWERSPETNYEPSLALFANEDGLHLINELIIQSVSRMSVGGTLLLEADPRQHSTLIATAKSHGFHHIETRDFIVHLRRI